MKGNVIGSDIPEGVERLIILEHPNIDLDRVVEPLREDQVVLIQNVSPSGADVLMHRLADRFGLSDALELQAGFAEFLGHRHNIGKYFMSVNKRKDYQFITPHSEGSSFTRMQLASFFCYENNTDGGETILMNVDDSSVVWSSLRERLNRGRVDSRPLPPAEIIRARGLYQLNLPADLVREDDQIIQEHPTSIPGLTVVDVLAKPEKAYSRLLGRELHVYWDSIEANDFDSASEFARLLRRWGLLKEPPDGLQIRLLDADGGRRMWRSGVDYAQIFKYKIIRKLVPGDLIIANNFTWTHAANNWSPGSGTRTIAASFA